MKNVIVPSYGRSISVSDNSTSGNVDGGGQPSSQEGRQEEGSGGSQQCNQIREGSGSDSIWNEVEYLLGSLERTKAMLANGIDWDPDEIKWINERYRLCKRQALDYILCLNLSQVLSEVSFPGEQLSYLQVAERVVTDCSSWELEKAIREIGLNPYTRTYFKATPKVPPIEQLEQILLTMMGDTDYVVAANFNDRFAINPHSAEYVKIKKDLTSAGWKWKSKRIGNRVVKVIQM